MIYDDVESTAEIDYDYVARCSDTELSEYIGELRKTSEKNPHVIRVSEHYVSKSYRADELEDVKPAIERAISLGVRAPPIRRIVKRADVLECVQDRIDGPNLMNSWSSIGLFTTIRLAFQLRGMVQKMRTAKSPTAGSLGTGICHSFWIEDRHRLPVSPSARVIACVVNFWYNHKTFKQESRKTPQEHFESVDKPVAVEPLVFTHHDLAPRNLMVDSSKNLWLVDWDYAGWYPPYFEYAGMHNFGPPTTWSRLD
ncbi:hypothetical protein M406DRAFT_330500 [Cryphonectria parasitica EP155]|uniref:Aminoglycoside phosphotransferase domain-containing protein n=1 Tax=Cryphonectria parasitica (strain ATCC 38755 / EP155) TaxID=660469 RepID=A0A9P5CMA0_CRYP1|nr:uncharacterized protein M406DRAFT_330500 [Cryphonectria parasitica EP155]KAF3764149.1 hypothetical protein M406DRAFT_330500 [Cryphonectria parasitica EP155]